VFRNSSVIVHGSGVGVPTTTRRRRQQLIGLTALITRRASCLWWHHLAGTCSPSADMQITCRLRRRGQEVPRPLMRPPTRCLFAFDVIEKCSFLPIPIPIRGCSFFLKTFLRDTMPLTTLNQ